MMRSRIFNITKRSMGFAVQFDKTGNPTEVLKRVSIASIGKPETDQIAIKFLAAPINPSDINTVQGVYGNKPNLPAIAGNEGVAVVTQVGSNARQYFQKGDWVIPHGAGFGTWREEAIANVDSVVKVPNDIPVGAAATIGVNPCSAYRMLKDFGNLQNGDYIIQNCANSMVGYSVVQLARLMGYKTINIIRSERPDCEKMLRFLDHLGGDINITDAYLRTREFKEIVDELPGSIKLALNGVSGESVTDIARVVPHGTTIVSYGGMSKQPVTIPHDLLTYKQLNLTGFWMAKWNEEHSREARGLMIDDIAGWIREKQFSVFTEFHDFDDFPYALEKSLLPFKFRKIVLNMDYPDRMAELEELVKDPKNLRMFRPLTPNETA